MWRHGVIGVQRRGNLAAGRARPDRALPGKARSAIYGVHKLSTGRIAPPLGRKIEHGGELRRDKANVDAASARHRSKPGKKKGKNPIVRGNMVDANVRRGPRRVTAGVAIRPIGLARRVFVRKPHWTAAEMQELADRLFILGRNESINSVLIANDDPNQQKEGECLPQSLQALDQYATELALAGPRGLAAVQFRRLMKEIGETTLANDDQEENIPLVSNGLDPRFLYESGLHNDPEAIRTVLRSISSLSRAARGGTEREEDDSETIVGQSRVPILTVPNGLVTDGGYALCMASYVLVTQLSRYQILNPTRGLSLDPTGASFLLPRLGQEFQQSSAMRYSLACAIVLALGAFSADALDMVETGLATHYLEASSKIPALEEALADLRPYNRQGILQTPTQLYVNPHDEADSTSLLNPSPGTNTFTENDDDDDDEHEGNFYFDPNEDGNELFRNRALANLLSCFCVFDASSYEVPHRQENDAFWQDVSDPSLVGMTQRHASSAVFEKTSQLLQVAALLHDVVQQEATLVGLIDGLERMAKKQQMQSRDPEQSPGGLKEQEVAAALLEKMKEASPLALHATFRLLQLGCRDSETLETCMAREVHVLTELYQKEDYRNWAAAKDEEDGVPSRWTHASIRDVSVEEVDALFEGGP